MPKLAHFVMPILELNQNQHSCSMGRLMCLSSKMNQIGIGNRVGRDRCPRYMYMDEI